MQYCAAPLSRRDIRALAIKFRRWLGLENVLYFPVVEVLERLHILFPDFHYEVVDKTHFGDIHVHAETDIGACCIRIREDVYEGACWGNGRDRMTVCHEIGHLLLVDPCNARLYRRVDGQPVKACRDPEWQANCFAGELLVPKRLAAGMGVEEVVEFCGASREAAEYQLKKFNEEEGDAERHCKNKAAPRNHGE